MGLIHKLLRIILILVTIYFIMGTCLLAYYEIVIYPDSLANIFETCAKHLLLIHHSGTEALEKLLHATDDAIKKI